MSGSAAGAGGSGSTAEASKVLASAVGVGSREPAEGTSIVLIVSAAASGGGSVRGTAKVLESTAGGGSARGAPNCWRRALNWGRCPGLNKP